MADSINIFLPYPESTVREKLLKNWRKDDGGGGGERGGEDLAFHYCEFLIGFLLFLLDLLQIISCCEEVMHIYITTMCNASIMYDII